MAPIHIPRALDGGDANTNALGITYVVAAIFYTALLAGEIYMLCRYRSAFCIRIRGLEVTLTSVASLHVYLIIVLLVYPLNGNWPCPAEFWVMSIFLPTGMAIFQSCNARVLSVYEAQRRLQRDFLAGARKKRLSYTPRGLFEAWLDLDASAKVRVCTYIGLVLSFLPAFILFLGSRRFHSDFGFFGPIVDARLCRQGGEWVPSMLVQLFWTAVVGPWILWKIRKVNDVHAWAWQTRLAVLAGLPGTPLWLAFTYSKIPAMMNINMFFPTAGWFIPSLVVCQQVLIVIPLLEAIRTPARNHSDNESIASISTTTSEKTPKSIMTKESKAKVCMKALEYSIEHHMDRLIDWTASREFTAENTIFLREVRNFKNKWSPLTTVTTAQRRQMHTEASLIFFTLVDPFTAETPINIEYKIFKMLQSQFEGMEYDPYMPQSRSPSPAATREHVVCPWEVTLDRPTSYDSRTSVSSSASTKSIVPSEFTLDVFDAAYESIKYLVFTNTWPRFVDAELNSDGDLRSP